MRSTYLALLACALPLLTACGDDKEGPDSASDGTANTNPTSDTGGTTEAPTTTPMTSTDGSTTEAPTTTPPTSTDPTTGDTDDTGSAGGSKMEEFGHACTADADCVAVLGDGGVCLKDILMVYELPGGFCSKTCKLPDPNTAYVPNAPECGQGVTCLGAMGYFEGCAIECTDNSQCPREGYECRIMPQIGKDGDPKFCLMTDEYML